PGEDSEQRRLPGAGWPEQGHRLTWFDVEIDPGERDDVVSLKPVDIDQPAATHPDAGLLRVALHAALPSRSSSGVARRTCRSTTSTPSARPANVVAAATASAPGPGS